MVAGSSATLATRRSKVLKRGIGPSPRARALALFPRIALGPFQAEATSVQQRQGHGGGPTWPNGPTCGRPKRLFGLDIWRLGEFRKPHRRANGAPHRRSPNENGTQTDDGRDGDPKGDIKENGVGLGQIDEHEHAHRPYRERVGRDDGHQPLHRKDP